MKNEKTKMEEMKEMEGNEKMKDFPQNENNEMEIKHFLDKNNENRPW